MKRSAFIHFFPKLITRPISPSLCPSYPSLAFSTLHRPSVNHRSRFLYPSLIRSQASECEPDNPTYPSNRSAALYELGDYLATVHAILRVAKIISRDGQVTDPNIQLARKLSVRLAKALLHGNRGRKIPDEVIGRPEHQTVFKVLERVVSDDPNAVKLWNAWSAATKEKAEDALKAKLTLLELPIWHKPPCVPPAQRFSYSFLPNVVAWELDMNLGSMPTDPAHTPFLCLSFWG
jgi:hypothetical protein